MKLVITLTTGDLLAAKTSDLTELEIDNLKSVIQDMLKSKQADGWYLSMETHDGWAAVPGRSIFYVELVDQRT